LDVLYENQWKSIILPELGHSPGSQTSDRMQWSKNWLVQADYLRFTTLTMGWAPKK
jgi:hypothetical protein